MALDITKGLFGVNIPDSLSADQAQGIAFAQLSPEQSVRATGFAAGKMFGRGLGDLGRAAFGGVTGVDVRTPQERMQSAQAEIIEEMRSGNINPENPSAYLPVVARVFQKNGMVQEAMQAAAALQQFKQEALKNEAEVAAKWASANKDIAEAKNKGVGWLQNGIATGILKPQSVKKYMESGNLDDLQFRGKYSSTADILGDDGNVYKIAFSPDDPMAYEVLGRTESKHADPTRGATAKINTVNGLLRKYGYVEGGDVGAALKRMQDENATDYNTYVANAKDLVGADNLDQMLRTGVFKVTEEERKSILQAEAGYRAVRDFKHMYGSAPPPLKRTDVASAVSEVEATNDAKDIPANVALRKIEDPKVRNYIIAVAKMAYPRLRLETGAAISATEWATVLRNILPYADDPADVQRQKLQQAFEQNKALLVMANTTSRAAPEVFKALFPGEDMASMFAGWDKMVPGAGGKPSEKVGSDLLSEAKAVYDRGDKAEWAKYWKSLSKQQQEVLKPFMKVTK